MVHLLPVSGVLMHILPRTQGRLIPPLLMGFMLVALLLGLFLVFEEFLPGIVAWFQQRSQMKTRNAHAISRHLIIKRLQGNAHSLWLTTLLCAITITMLGSSAMLFQYNQDLVQREIPTTVVAAGAGVDNVTKILAKAKVKPTQAIILSSKLVYAEIRLRDQADQVRKQPGVYNVIAMRDYQRAAHLQHYLAPVRLRGNEALLMLPTRTSFRPVGARRNPDRAIILPGSDASLLLTRIFSRPAETIFLTGGCLSVIGRLTCLKERLIDCIWLAYLSPKQPPLRCDNYSTWRIVKIFKSMSILAVLSGMAMI